MQPILRSQEPRYEVTLTIRLSTSVAFANFPGGENDIITADDAIDNAIGQLPEEFFDGFGGEFEVALPIDGEVTNVDYIG